MRGSCGPTAAPDPPIDSDREYFAACERISAAEERAFAVLKAATLRRSASLAEEYAHDALREVRDAEIWLERGEREWSERSLASAAAFAERAERLLGDENALARETVERIRSCLDSAAEFIETLEARIGQQQRKPGALLAVMAGAQLLRARQLIAEAERLARRAPPPNGRNAA